MLVLLNNFGFSGGGVVLGPWSRGTKLPGFSVGMKKGQYLILTVVLAAFHILHIFPHFPKENTPETINRI